MSKNPSKKKIFTAKFIVKKIRKIFTAKFIVKKISKNLKIFSQIHCKKKSKKLFSLKKKTLSGTFKNFLSWNIKYFEILARKNFWS